MGIIDKSSHTLTCERCKVQETVTTLDKGSGWRGSKWESGKPFQKFTAKWKGGGKEEPEIIDASCNACSAKAQVSTSYTG